MRLNGWQLVMILLLISGCTDGKDRKIAELTKKVEEQSKILELQLKEKAKEAIRQPTHQLPTATEVFNLRTECAKLGELIINEIPIRNGIYRSQTSHYASKENRCYVDLTEQSADLTEILGEFLYDGQTKDILA